MDNQLNQDHPFPFPHHTFTDDEVSGRYELVPSDRAVATNDPTPRDVGATPRLFRQAGVGRIVLVHGTFAGNDLVGIAREITRFSPSMAARLSDLGKRWFDELAGEVGNYSVSFAECLSNLVNPPEMKPIPVTRFEWSGENHHLGRADGAMSLIEQLVSYGENDRDRVLIFAHSHGGNLLAMLSHIVAADMETKQEFFERTKLHYHSLLRQHADLPAWQRVRERLVNQPGASFPPLDVATFGTPLRYRFNTSVCQNLLHFVQHRRASDAHPERASLPRGIQQLLEAQGGDYVQHIGIAGTDFLPSVFAWRDWLVERRMRRMFEHRVRRRRLIQNLRMGRRVSADGMTLLVDYAGTDEGWNRKLFGHGVYTCRQWLPFHLREITQRFYGESEGPGTPRS